MKAAIGIRELTRRAVLTVGRYTKRAAIAGASAIILAGSVAPSHAATPLRIHYYPNVFVMLPVWVAQEKAFFTANGIEAQLFDLSNGTVAVTALASGSIDVLQMPPNYTIVYNNKNPEQRVTQLTSLYGAVIYSLMGKKELVEQCADAKKPYPQPINCMKGKKVGIVALGSDNYQVVKSLLSQVGLKETDVELIPTGGTVGTVNMIKTGQIEFGIMAEPGSTLALDSKLVERLVHITDDPLMNPWIGNASFASTAAVKQDPGKYGAYALAIGEAVKFILDEKNFNEVRDILLKYMKVDPVIATAMLHENFKYFSSKNDCTAVENQNKWLVQTGQLPAGKEANCQDFFLSAK